MRSVYRSIMGDAHVLCATLGCCVRMFFARPPSRIRNGTFLVKVLARFPAKVPNFPNASDAYVYLCVIYHKRISRAVMYIFVTAKSRAGEMKKETPMRLPFFHRRQTRAFRRDETPSPFRKPSNYNHECASCTSAKFHLIVIARLP